MRIVMFYHSLVSDWNHGNAHFLRGVATELRARGCEVSIFEPRDGWSLRNLIADHGTAPIERFHAVYPGLVSRMYDLERLDLDEALDGADLVLVHEWNEPELVARIGERRARGTFRLLFHDTHHRALTEPDRIGALDLRHYDGVLAFGAVIRDLYLERGWTQRAWVWHEAADTRVFRPLSRTERAGGLVWIGNWGDEERSAELVRFLIEPVRELSLRATVYGVRYPDRAKARMADAGIRYGGWISNFDVPWAFSRHGVTIHVPRRPYVRLLPGVPTIRVFEALACGIPLVCSPWEDVEGLFRAGDDYLVARTGSEMCRHLRAVLNDDALATHLVEHGLQTIRSRHTCSHRVDELLRIYRELAPVRPEPALAV